MTEQEIIAAPLEDPANIFHNAKSITELMGQFAGFSAMCFEPNLTPVTTVQELTFDSRRATDGYNMAVARLVEMMKKQGYVDFDPDELSKKV